MRPSRSRRGDEWTAACFAAISVALLKDDHARDRALFDQFEQAKLHAAIEEELFYPAVRKPVGKEVMNEADEEHHVALSKFFGRAAVGSLRRPRCECRVRKDEG